LVAGTATMFPCFRQARSCCGPAAEMHPRFSSPVSVERHFRLKPFFDRRLFF
jgi:hypothetical protein